MCGNSWSWRSPLHEKGVGRANARPGGVGRPWMPALPCHRPEPGWHGPVSLAEEGSAVRASRSRPEPGWRDSQMHHTCMGLGALGRSLAGARLAILGDECVPGHVVGAAPCSRRPGPGWRYHPRTRRPQSRARSCRASDGCTAMNDRPGPGPGSRPIAPPSARSASQPRAGIPGSSCRASDG